MNIKFLLKEPNGNSKTLISLYARFKGQRLVYSSGQKILPEYWDFETQRPVENHKKIKRNSIIRKELDEIVTILVKHESNLREIYNDFQIKGITPKINELKNELDNKLKTENKKKPVTRYASFFEFIDNFIEQSSKTKSTIQVYKSTRDHLLQFQQETRQKIEFDTISLELYEKLIRYFNNKNYSRNTVGKIIKTLKTFLNEATERGLNKNLIFKSKKFKVLNEESDSIYLTQSEIGIFNDLDLSDKPKLDNARDIFVVACYTGLRYSDFDQIKKENIIDDNFGRYLKIRTQKTGEEVIIPLNNIVEQILNKRDGHLPKIISNQKLNSYLKEIGLLAGITDNISINKTKGGLRSSAYFPKYKLITAHTARRSFSSNAYLADVPVVSIMKITGHKTERAFMKYIKISKEDNARKLLNHPFFQSKLKIVK